MNDTLTTAATALLTRTTDEDIQLSDTARGHLSTIIETCALLEDLEQLEAEASSLLGLADVLRTEHGASAAAAALETALRAAPTAARRLRLDRPTGPAIMARGRELEVVTGASAQVQRAPTGREAAPAGSFKPPRPARLR